MSFPLNISFKDNEFKKISKAAEKEGKEIRDFAKDAALEKAETILKGEC